MLPAIDSYYQIPPAERKRGRAFLGSNFRTPTGLENRSWKYGICSVCHVLS